MPVLYLTDDLEMRSKVSIAENLTIVTFQMLFPFSCEITMYIFKLG